MDDDLRRALRNGAIAAVAAAIVGFSLDAAFSGGDGQPAATGTPKPAAPTCMPMWETASSADPDLGGNQLLGVSALSRNEVWAVGARGPAEAPVATLVERWDGERWEVVASANVGTVANVLRAVDAMSADDAWAVGSTSSGGDDQPLILHWDGASWSASTVPYVTAGASLSGVVAVSRDDAWAVGSAGDKTLGLERAFALHWDGLSWTETTVPAGGGRSLLASVGAASSNDVWAVGYRQRRPLVMRFDGDTWAPVAIEATGALSAVAVIAPDEIWAVGSSIWSWDGSSWTESATIRGNGSLLGVAGASPDDVWAVGSRPAGGGTRALAERFGGRRWTLVAGRGVQGSDVFTSVAALPSGAVWMAGYSDTPKGRVTLVARRVRWCG
ncbi:MAG: hypothetical protein AB1551_00910 [Actinomycetota bacterium]